jgi:serine/threonine-protein kinase
MVGRKIGQYQFLEKLGAGGMGEIYKAQDTRLGRFVAIKVLPSARSGDPERRRRFLQEAQAASGLNHPSIITIHDIVSEGDTEFMVMEYVAGKTLNDLIPKGGLRVPQALKYALQMSDALNAAHAAGIVHRDLKPANIMVTETGLVKVLDFGLAKLTDRTSTITQIGEDAETIATTGPLTVEGSILGTVSYMSPEQAQGKKIDTRSDIFSFGAVLYEMLTGRRAFEGESSLSTMSAILRDEVRPMTEVAPDVPPELETVIQRCLRKLPDHRWQTMREVQGALSILKRDADSGSLYGSRAASPSAPASSLAVAGFAGAASTIKTPASAAKAPSKPPAHPPAYLTKLNPMMAIAAGVLVLILVGGVWFMKYQAAKRAAAETAAAAAAAEAAAQAAVRPPAPVDVAPPPPAVEKMTNDSVLELVQGKVPTGLILDQIRNAPSTQFDLSTAEIIRLSKGGVSQTIVDQMRDPKRVAPVVAAAPASAKVPPPVATPVKPAATPSNTTPVPVAQPVPAPAATAPPPPPTPAPPPKPQTTPVTVLDATPFRMILAADIPLTADLDEPVKFTMAEDFKVGGVVVIAKGLGVTGAISETPKKKKFLGILGGAKLSFTLSKAYGAGGVELNVRSLSARRADGATQRAVDTGKSGSKTVAAIQGTEYVGYIDGTQTVNVPK